MYLLLYQGDTIPVTANLNADLTATFDLAGQVLDLITHRTYNLMELRNVWGVGWHYSDVEGFVAIRESMSPDMTNVKQRAARRASGSTVRGRTAWVSCKLHGRYFDCAFGVDLDTPTVSIRSFALVA